MGAPEEKLAEGPERKPDEEPDDRAVGKPDDEAEGEPEVVTGKEDVGKAEGEWAEDSAGFERFIWKAKRRALTSLFI